VPRKAKKNYSIRSVAEAKKLAKLWVDEYGFQDSVSFGLPEVDDRYNIWRVPLIARTNKHRVGEVNIDAVTSLIDDNKTTRPGVVEERLLQSVKLKTETKRNSKYEVSQLRNTIAEGDAETVLDELPAHSVDLIFTSPPYFNVRPEYSDYVNYEEYLLKMRKIIQQCHRVLNEGRFFIMNTSPVLLRRASRSQASKRIAVPFDLHRIFTEEGFDFMDDIIWVKPEGAGWATGRGRRFAADRTPLQYKPVPVTEHVMVYRKQTDRLLDWNIRSYPDQPIVEASKIKDGYEKTEIWRITPAYDKKHPAIFPLELADKIVKYYSFKTDVVLDPFAGIGTTAQAAVKNGRRFVAIDLEKQYVEEIKARAKKWLGREYADIHFMNCLPGNEGQEQSI
jgi:DNA modification methylase